MILESFPVGLLGCNCTVIGDETSHEALVIDPGGNPERIEERLVRHDLTVKQILLTHAHIDHIGALAAIKQRTGAPVFLCGDDLALLQAAGQQAAMFGMPTPEAVLPDEGLSDGQTVGLASHPATVLHTPGHTQGSVCFYFAAEHLLIAGDTLFAGGIGRTDLPGGNADQIFTSIRTKLLTLPDATAVVTGHGPATTIGAERVGNPFLQGM
jgi:hydroxyacylglutathione hydrolase